MPDKSQYRFGPAAFLLALLWSAPGAAEVGYVNILNGADPARAFVIERQGRLLAPEGLYTNLEEDDLVRPAPEALLIFTPLDAACEAVEINGEFTATSCPPPPGGLKNLAYDFVAGQFLAAPQEKVGLYATRGGDGQATRGGDGQRLYSLPPQVLQVFVESAALAETLKKTPFLALTQDRGRAQALILGQGPVRLSGSDGAAEGRLFNLPAEGPALRQALLNRLNYHGLAALASPGPWPDLDWKINIHTTAPDGPLAYDGRKWALVKTVIAETKPAAPLAGPENCLLTFEIVNRGLRPYYAYLINYTDAGQLLPVLPPLEAPDLANLAGPGQTLDLGRIQLELNAPKEYVRLIVSEKPLDLGQFQQESLEAPAAPGARAGLLRPVPENSWRTLAQAFELK